MKILTYNVLWETIQNKTNLTNITQAIDTMGKYDFIAIQEAISVSDLQNNSKILKKMGYVFTPDKPAKLLTFFNKKKYEILGVHYGGFKCHDCAGRPYHIIYVLRKEDQQRFMVINTHMPHLSNQGEIESVITKQLSHNFDEGFDNSKKLTEIDLVNFRESSDNLSHHLIDHHYLGIFMGDINDHGILDLWQGFKPIQSKYHHQKHQYLNLDGITVSCQNKKPPVSCCLEINRSNPYMISFLKMKSQENSYSDYILVDEKLEIKVPNQIPPSFNPDFIQNPCSDHSPIELEVRTRNLKSQSPSSVSIKKNKGFQLGNFYCEMVNI